jgi:hypothetical protein
MSGERYDDITPDELDLKETSIDDSVEIVVRTYPLKYILKALILNHGSNAVREAADELLNK